MIPAFLANIELAKLKEPTDELRIGDGGTSWTPPMVDPVGEEDDDIVLETMGGGSKPPPEPSPEEKANAQIRIDEAKAAREEAVRVAQAATDETNRLGRVDKASSYQNNLYNQAAGGYDNFSSGYDEQTMDRYDVRGDFMSALDAQRGGWGDEDASVNLNGQNVFNDVLQQNNKQRRRSLDNDWGDIYGQDAAMGLFGDSMDDNLIADMLGQRGDDARAQIDDAYARGQLNDGGYNRAMTEFDNQSMVARNNLDTIGQGLLTGYRQQADIYNENQRNDIGNLGFNDNYSARTAQTGLDALVSRLSGGMQGDFMNAVQGQKFYNPNSAISKAGSLQGYYNTTGSNVAGTAGGNNNTNNNDENNNGVF